jgi:hypothetical protein
MKYLNAVCEKPGSREPSFGFWNKLYADDIVLSVHYEHQERLMVNLCKVSEDHELIINPKKCAVFAVCKHSKIAPGSKLLEILVVTE